MIVCSCNLLTDGDVKGCLAPGPECPRTPAQVYRCLGCSPNCGSCARTIRSIMNNALTAAKAECCAAGNCPHAHAHAHAAHAPAQPQLERVLG